VKSTHKNFLHKNFVSCAEVSAAQFGVKNNQNCAAGIAVRFAARIAADEANCV
jgi:hypothetical protein